MIEIEPSPSVERAKQMLKDPDSYFAEARARAEDEVRAERVARRRRPRGQVVRVRDYIVRLVAHVRGSRLSRSRSR